MLRLYDPPLWRILVTDLSSATVSLLDSRATDRSFTFTLNGSAQHSGLVATDDPEINLPFSTNGPPLMDHNDRLVYGLRREVRASPGDDPWVCRFGGILMGLEDVGADAATCRYTAYDPWQYLFSRPARNPETGALIGPNGYTYTNERGSVMATQLLAATILLDGEVFIDLTDTSLVHATPVIPGKTNFAAGLTVGEAWSQLVDTGYIDIKLPPIYDPVGKPGKVCQLWTGDPAVNYTVQHDAIFGWDTAGNNITSLSRLTDGTRLANEVQFYAGQGGPPVTLQTDAASVARYGEYWAQQFLVAGQGQSGWVELAALKELETRRDGHPTFEFTPAPERAPLALRDYALGDYVPVWASRNLRAPLEPQQEYLLAYDVPLGYQRIHQLPIAVDDNGVERPGAIITVAESG